MPIFRASELDRLLACAGSGWLQRQDHEGPAAAWGTKVHGWMETGELPEGDDGTLLAKRIKKSGVDRAKLWPVSGESGEFEVPVAYNLVNGRAIRYVAVAGGPVGGAALRAHKSAWKAAFDNEWVTGTLDFAAELMDTYWIDDLKTGREAHWADYAAQQSFYALAWSTIKYGEIRDGRSTITHWPNYPITRAPVRHGASLEVPALLAFVKRLQGLRETVLGRSGSLKVGDHCRFCPSKLYCPELLNLGD